MRLLSTESTRMATAAGLEVPPPACITHDGPSMGGPDAPAIETARSSEALVAARLYAREADSQDRAAPTISAGGAPR
jgi:hypothetical protein